MTIYGHDRSLHPKDTTTNLQTSLPSGKLETWRTRYTVLTLIWLAWLLSFLDRMVMSVSLPYTGKDLNPDTTQRGLIISASLIGYAAFQIPGGLLADKFGSCKIMATGTVWWSVLTSLTDAVVTLSLVLAIRFFFGIGEGRFPSTSWKVILTYFPSKEHGRATAVQSMANTLDPALVVVVAASIIGTFGQHVVFIVLGISGLFIAAGIYLLTHGNPKDHPTITQQGLAELTVDDQGGLQNISAIVLEDVLKMSVLWQMVSAWFLFDIVLWGFSTWPPSYLITIREFSLTKTGAMAVIPFLFGVGGTLSGGYCSDRLKPQCKTLYAVTSVTAAGFLYLTFSVGSADTAVVYQCVSALFMFFVMAVFWDILMDMIPSNIMGWTSGIANFGGQVAGVVSVPVINWPIQSSGGSYNSAFIFMTVVLLCSAVVILTVEGSHVVGALPSKA